MTIKLGSDSVHDRKRHYRLTQKGLRALRSAIRRSQPWTKSTGPRTSAGKSRVAMNAYRHGERSVASVSLRKLATETIKALKTESRAKAIGPESAARQ